MDTNTAENIIETAAPVITKQDIVIIKKLGKMEDPGFINLNWVIKALSTDTMRKALTMVNVTSDGDAQATDGYRLHIGKLHDYHGGKVTPGLYAVKSKNKNTIVLEADKDGYEFPDVHRVIKADGEEEYKQDVTSTDGEKSQFYRAVYFNGLFNESYLSDMCMNGKKSVAMTVRVYPMSKSKLIKITETSTTTDETTKQEIVTTERLGILMGMIE